MDVVVVGSCNVDLVSYVPRLPKTGETIEGSKFSTGFGGKGSNQCVCCSRLGAKTALVAKIGTDTFGDDYLQNLKDSLVNVEFVYRTDQAATGVAPIAVTHQGENSIIIVPGANLLLTEENVLAAEEVIKSAKVLICQLEIKPSVSLSALRLAKKHGVKTILNPAPAQANLDPEMFQLADIFCPNETETEILTGVSVSSVEDAKAAIPSLREKGCSTVIITMGENGAVLSLNSEDAPLHIPARKVKAVDTSGAGDAFVGGLAYYLSAIPNLELKEMVRRAGEIASDSVQRPGTQKSFLPHSKLDPALFQ